MAVTIDTPEPQGATDGSASPMRRPLGAIDKYTSFRLPPPPPKRRLLWCKSCHVVQHARDREAGRNTADAADFGGPMKRLLVFVVQAALVFCTGYLSVFSLLRVCTAGATLKADEVLGGLVLFVMSSCLSVGFVASFLGWQDPSAPRGGGPGQAPPPPKRVAGGGRLKRRLLKRSKRRVKERADKKEKTERYRRQQVRVARAAASNARLPDPCPAEPLRDALGPGSFLDDAASADEAPTRGTGEGRAPKSKLPRLQAPSGRAVGKDKPRPTGGSRRWGGFLRAASPLQYGTTYGSPHGADAAAGDEQGEAKDEMNLEAGQGGGALVGLLASEERRASATTVEARAVKGRREAANRARVQAERERRDAAKAAKLQGQEAGAGSPVAGAALGQGSSVAARRNNRDSKPFIGGSSNTSVGALGTNI